MDLQIRQFRNELLQLVNSKELPIEVKRLVLCEVYHAVSEASDTFITQQQQNQAMPEEEDLDE